MVPLFLLLPVLCAEHVATWYRIPLWSAVLALTFSLYEIILLHVCHNLGIVSMHLPEYVG